MCDSKAESKELISQRRRGRPAGCYGEYRKVRIGADPEFELHKNGQFYPAHNILSGLRSPVGTDGNTTTGELRPCLKAGGRADSLYYFDKDAPTAPDSQGISSLLDQLARKLDETFAVYAGSGCHKPLGGHIHFSGVEVDAVFLTALDRFITRPLNEVSKTHVREASPYGRLGSIERGKPHGGWEYRACPSWICTPDITKGVIAIAWVLAQAQNHGSIAHFQTFDDFYTYARKGHARNIKRFTAVLAALKQRRVKLEEIEVLKAWGKHELLKPIKKPVKRTRKKQAPVARPLDWAMSDSYIPEIAERVGSLTSPNEVRIVGANQLRNPCKAVFLPSGWGLHFPLPRDITIQHWNLPSIGLSWSLRQNVPLAALVVRALVGSVRPCA
jgi:Phage phiEco32-like COOH.NH2 ligase-type 2